MSASFISDTSPYDSYRNATVLSPDGSLLISNTANESGWLQGLARRWHRERRRRKVGRAYDMALEIARLIPRNSSVLDVGCGNGYIAHHLSALLGARVLGIDLEETTDAPINYRRFDGTRFPVHDQSMDAVLLCYVLHHAQDLTTVLSEVRRVLRVGGLAVVYEDTPGGTWDRMMCEIHNRRWRRRSGRCTFRRNHEWRKIFDSAGFAIVRERELSRWRNIAHPVRRSTSLLKLH